MLRNFPEYYKDIVFWLKKDNKECRGWLEPLFEANGNCYFVETGTTSSKPQPDILHDVDDVKEWKYI